MFVLFVQNAAILIVLCLFQRAIALYWKRGETSRQAVSGVLFGVAAITVMALPALRADDVIFDARSVVLAVGGLLGGPLVAGISGVMAAAFRLWLGGAAALVGLCVIATDVALGLLAHEILVKRRKTLTWAHVVAFGFVVHVANVAWFYMLPAPVLQQFLSTALIPYLAVLTLATAVLTVFLRDIVLRESIGRLLDDSETHYKAIFDNAIVSIWEEDLSRLYRALQQLRDQGVRDLRAYLDADPAAAAALARTIEVTTVNRAALAMFDAESAQQLTRRIDQTFGAGALDVFKNSICAIWEGRPAFRAEAEFRSLKGRTLHGIISIPLPADERAARRVPVSILDVTELKAAERATEHERQRLQEIIWGTKAATWEWNVRTGEVHLNDRWAEIVGYALAELQPSTVDTWAALVHPDDLQESKRMLRRCFAREIDYYEIETRLRHKTGDWVWVLDRGKVVEWQGDEAVRMAGTHTDITVIKRAELEFKRLVTVRQTLAHFHRIAIGEKDETQLFQELCDILVKNHGYALAWVGVPRADAAKRVDVVGKAGALAAGLERVSMSWADDKFGQTATGRAIRSGLVQIVQDGATAATLMPWITGPVTDALNAAVALPVTIDSRVIAVLNVYRASDQKFGESEVAVLVEFCIDLGFAIRALRAEDERNRIDVALRNSSIGVVRAIATTIEKRDPYTAGHQARVAQLCVRIATELGWTQARIEGLRLGAMIHDIGKIYVPAEILNRPGRLTSSEFALIKSHPEVGREIISSVALPWPIAEMIAQHHERLDGKGYPAGLTGDQIIDEAKIIAVADVVEAMAYHRPYRPALGLAAASAEIVKGRGTAFEPRIVDACLKVIKDGYDWTQPAATPAAALPSPAAAQMAQSAAG